MLKNITLGQYFPGRSLIHRLDPRIKLTLTFAYIVILFIAKGPVAYGLLMLWLVSAILLSRLPVNVIFRGMKPLVFIILLTGILNIFYTPGNPIWPDIFLIRRISWEGLVQAGMMIWRILMLLTGTFLLTYTTSPILLTDALERLFGPLKWIRVPVHELAMMMTIALRFIPTLIEETAKIMSAQRARGADFESGNLIKRAKALIPLLVPLFVSAFRRADELAVAMECRCYHGGEGRTRMRQMRLAAIDFSVMLCFTVVAAAVVMMPRITEFIW
jgi:energy-coupling factor transport system permease protein